MAKYTLPALLDGPLTEVRNTATRMVVTNGQPASFAAANSGKLAEVTMAPGDFTLGAGSPNGRRLTVAAKAGVAVIASGSGDHVALLDVTNSRLLHVTTCPAVSLVSGGTVDIAGWSIQFGDPT